MTDLAKRKCIPCSGSTPRLEERDWRPLLSQLGEGWEVIGGHHLDKRFAFPDFQAALDFVNRVGALAEAEGHHPDLHLAWGSTRVTLWTHAIDGLSESDFILAAKIDEVA